MAEGLVLWRYEAGGQWSFLKEFGFGGSEKWNLRTSWIRTAGSELTSAIIVFLRLSYPLTVFDIFGDRETCIHFSVIKRRIRPPW